MLEVRTAGDPDDAKVLWTDLSPQAIAETMEDLGTPVSPPVIRNWLDEQGLKLRKIVKTLAGGQSPRREASSNASRP